MMKLKLSFLEPMDIIIGKDRNLLVIGWCGDKLECTEAAKGSSDATTWNHCDVGYYLKNYMQEDELTILRPRRRDVALMPRWFYRAEPGGVLTEDITDKCMVKEMTLQEIEKELGHLVEIVG